MFRKFLLMHRGFTGWKYYGGIAPGYTPITSGYRMKKVSWINYLDYFYVSRPVLFFPGWNTLVAGFLVANGLNNDILHLLKGSFHFHFFPGQLILMMGAFAAAMGGSFILNQLQDIDSDKKNEKLFLIGENHVSKRQAMGESGILIAISLCAAALINRETLLFIALFILITGYFYNFKPFECKNKPISGLILNMLMGWIAFALGWILFGTFSTALFIQSLPYLLLNTGLYLLTTIPDISGDRTVGKETFSVKFGTKLTIWVSLFCFAAAVISGIFLKDYFVISLFVLTSFWIFKLTVKMHINQVLKSTKIIIFVFSLLIAFNYWPYLVLIVLLLFLTKYYYRNRFNFDYPNLRGE